MGVHFGYEQGCDVSDGSGEDGHDNEGGHGPGPSDKPGKAHGHDCCDEEGLVPDLGGEDNHEGGAKGVAEVGRFGRQAAAHCSGVVYIMSLAKTSP